MSYRDDVYTQKGRVEAIRREREEALEELAAIIKKTKGMGIGRIRHRLKRVLAVLDGSQ